MTATTEMDTMIDLRLHDSRNPWPLNPGTVHLVCGSPPYFGAEEAIVYDAYRYASDESAWRDDFVRVAQQAMQALVPGGRFAVNVANTGRKPYTDLAGIVGSAMREVGFDLRGHIIWLKGYHVAGTAWGSVLSPSAPVLRDVHEYIVVAQKGDGTLDMSAFKKRQDLDGGEFGNLTFSVWEVSAGARDRWQKTCDHPAPWPVELVRRLVRLYTAPGMTVLDPWVGSGTTCAVALEQKCYAIGYDLSDVYLETAKAWCGETMGQYYRPKKRTLSRGDIPLLGGWEETGD